VVFPLFDKPEHQQVLFTGLQDGDPLLKLKGQAAAGRVRCDGEPAIHILQIDRRHLMRAPGQVPAYCATGDLKQPRAKQPPVPDLPGLLIDLEHHFLSQVLCDSDFVAALSKERHHLRPENVKKFGERVFAGIVQELVGNLALPEIGHCESFPFAKRFDVMSRSLGPVDTGLESTGIGLSPPCLPVAPQIQMQLRSFGGQNHDVIDSKGLEFSVRAATRLLFNPLGKRQSLCRTNLAQYNMGPWQGG